MAGQDLCLRSNSISLSQVGIRVVHKIFTVLIRTVGEGYVFTGICLSTGGLPSEGGGLPFERGGVSHFREYGNKVYVWSVRILLECIFVSEVILLFSLRKTRFDCMCVRFMCCCISWPDKNVEVP